MCPRQNQQQRSTTATYSPTSSTSNLAYHHPQSSTQELLKVDDAQSFMDRSMNNPADTPKSNNDLTTGNQNVDTSSSSSSLPQSAVFNPAMMMMLQLQQQQQQQQQFDADNVSAPQDATSGTFAPSGEQSIDATDVSSMLFSLANDMNNGMPTSYNHHQDQQVQQQQVNQLPPTAMVQVSQDHQLHHHHNGTNPSMNAIVNSSINNDRTGNVMSMSSNQNTTSASNFVETNPQQQQQMQMQMQSMASMMPAIPPAIAQQLFVQLQQQGPSALPSISLLTNSLGNAVINDPAATQHQQQLSAAQPSPSSAAVAVASASATGVPPRPKKVGRRGDPRMHEAVRYRLTHPKCTLLDALLHGGFSFPPLHLVNISDRFVRDGNGVTLSQRKNQLMRRLRVIEKGEESNGGDKKKKKTSSKKTTKKDNDDSSKSGYDSSTGTKSKGSGDDDASNDGDCGANVVIDGPPVPSSSMDLPPQQVQVPAIPDNTAVMIPSLPTSSSEGQGRGSEMEQQIRNQLLINQLKMVLLQQQIQKMAQAQAQNQQQEEEEEQQQQMNANDTLMSLQTDTSAPREEGAADERNAKSA